MRQTWLLKGAEFRVELPIFAGDIIHSENCYTFEGLGIPIKLVYGNNDGDRAGLARESSHRSSERPDDFWQIRAAGSDCPFAWRASSLKRLFLLLRKPAGIAI
ncbi:MAG: hypothetical protein KBA97_12370 [Methanothrix sp.]|nr:hypothetical protein [Methanothrix sp.]